MVYFFALFACIFHIPCWTVLSENLGPKYTSAGEWINKLVSIQQNVYSVIERNELLINALTWVNRKISMLYELSQRKE